MSTPSHAAHRAGEAGDGVVQRSQMPPRAEATRSDLASSADSGTARDADPATGAASRRKWWTRGPREAKPKKKASLLKELPILLIIAFGLAVLIKSFLFQAFFIPSGSMEPTLHGCPGCSGDRVLVNKIVYYFGEPQPGDIVVFEGPDTWAPEVQIAEPTNWFSSVMASLGRAIGVGPPSEKDYVKRVIAVGGQTVECCDAEGRVMVDGEPVDEPYIITNNPLESRSFPRVTVPDGRLWVMGDNRAGSADSRFHVTDQYSGTVAVDDVIGKAALIVWPFSRFTMLDDPDIQGLHAVALSGVSGVASPGAPLALGVGLMLPFAGRRRARLRGRHPPGGL
ncbi:MAG: signal peptidase I [Actinomycetota bacterium]|nr:signal peptidase I [Actinomycetota bacterium]